MSGSEHGCVRLAVAALVGLMVAGLFGCGGPTKTSDKDLQILSDRASLEQLLADDKDRTILIDVRSPSRFEVAHIPGAINIPVKKIVAGDSLLAEAKRLVVYSDGWAGTRDDYLSWAAAKKLLALGYQNVYDFRGGMQLWTREGGLAR